MIPAASSFLAWRYLLTRRINLLSTLGVMFAVWATLVVDGVFSGFVYEIQKDCQRASPDLLVTDLPEHTSYATLATALKQAGGDDVQALAPRLRHFALLQPLRARRGSTLLVNEVDFDPMQGGFAAMIGVDPLAEEQVLGVQHWPQHAAELLSRRGIGAEPTPIFAEPDPARKSQWLLPDELEWRARVRSGLPHANDANTHRSSWPGVLLSWRSFPYQSGVRLGEPIELLTAVQSSEPSNQGQVQSRHTRLAFAGYFGTGYRLLDEGAALLPIETLRTLLGHDLADPGSIDLVTDVAVKLRDGLSSAKQRACQAALTAALAQHLPGSAACVLDWHEQSEVYLSAVDHEHRMMQFVLFVVMLISAFLIYATLHMMVVQKWQDIGVLAAIGGGPRHIGLVFLLCGGVVGAVGATLGVGTALLTMRYLNALNDWLAAHFGIELFPRMLFDLQAVPMHSETAWVVLVACTAFLMTLLVSWLPARKAARMNPVQALAYE